MDSARARELYVSKNPADLPTCRCERDIAERERTDSIFAARSAGVMHFEKVTYKSRVDGMEIPAYLFAPLHPRGPKGHAAMVWVHGGVHSHMTEDYLPFIREAVQRGYVIITPNYRGSTGYGRTFERAGRGVWGLDDVGDCLFAGEYLAKLEWVDEERIAIVGRSYGGFLALGTLTRDPEHRFAAGVSLYGDCDLFTTWSTCTRGRRRDIEAAMGHPSAYHDAYNAGSPINRVDAIEVPLLVVHGDEDDVVPVEQARELVAELRRLDKPFEHVTYRTEGHGFAHAPTRLDFAQRLEQFLDWHLM